MSLEFFVVLLIGLVFALHLFVAQPVSPISLLRFPAFLVFALSGWMQGLSAQPSTSDKWTMTGSLDAGRQCHTATLLRDGRVLIVGGYGTSNELAIVEIYDPVKGVFSQASDLAQGRNDHTATLLSNGQVLVVGGQAGGNTLASSELYNPSTDKWTPTGNLHLARSYHTATLLSDGEVLVTGGTHWASPPVFVQGTPPGSALDVAELYDPSTGKWTVTDSMHAARFAHAATLLANGDVLVAGGIGSKRDGAISQPDELKAIEGQSWRMPGQLVGNAVKSVEIFDHKTKTWSETGDLLCARFNLTATLLTNGQVLVAGGQDSGNILAEAELYHVSSGTWTATESLQTARNGHTATLLSNGDVWVVGGANNSGVLNSTELFDPLTGTWQPAASLNQPHAGHTATILTNGKLLVSAGGFALGAPGYVQADAELYDLTQFLQTPPRNRVVSTGLATASPATAGDVSIASANPPYPPPATLMATAGGLVLVTICIVIITGCVVVLLAAWISFIFIRRFCK